MEKTYNLSEFAKIGALTSIYSGTTKSPQFIRESLIDAALKVGICLFRQGEDYSVIELDLPISEWTAVTKAGRTNGLDTEDAT